MNWIQEHFYNDMAFVPFYLGMFLLAFLIYFLAIYYHEFGHQFYFKKKLNKQVRIFFSYRPPFYFGWETGNMKDYADLKDKEYAQLLMTGVIFGTFPIILAGVLLWEGFALLLIPYAWGLKSDLRNFYEIYTKQSKSTP